jgi:hypothetical protein
MSNGGWPAPGSADTELGILMEPEVDHGEADVYTILSKRLSTVDFHTAWALPASPTCPLNGPSSTRCSAFPSINFRFELSLCKRGLRFRETGICGRRQRRPKGGQGLCALL